jgi:glycosyltransferase involved in cell wall biosynthesis
MDVSPDMTGAARGAARPLLSIVVPAHNEEKVLREFHERLSRSIAGLDMEVEIVFVNDGSRDGTLKVMREVRRQDPRIAIVDLSRNFGKEIAMTAGLDHVSGDAVVIIDADLQDPPELIPDLIREWRQGYDVVYARRVSREGEGAIKKFTAYLFYRIMRRSTRVRIPSDTGDFRLLSRRALDSLLKLREQHRFMKGLFAWIGYRQKAVTYRREARFAGATKYNYWALWNFAIEGFTSFSISPLRISSYLGLFTAACAFVYGFVMIFKTLVYGSPVPGYPSLMVVILFLGGIQLIAIGIIGEYLGRMFNETKKRPLYFVQEYAPSFHGTSSITAANIPSGRLASEESGDDPVQAAKP